MAKRQLGARAGGGVDEGDLGVLRLPRERVERGVGVEPGGVRRVLEAEVLLELEVVGAVGVAAVDARGEDAQDARGRGGAELREERLDERHSGEVVQGELGVEALRGLVAAVDGGDALGEDERVDPRAAGGHLAGAGADRGDEGRVAAEELVAAPAGPALAHLLDELAAARLVAPDGDDGVVGLGEAQGEGAPDAGRGAYNEGGAVREAGGGVARADGREGHLRVRGDGRVDCGAGVRWGAGVRGC